jgi:hypothetical protein
VESRGNLYKKSDDWKKFNMMDDYKVDLKDQQSIEGFYRDMKKTERQNYYINTKGFDLDLDQYKKVSKL